MADNTKYAVLDEQGVKQFAQEIFKLIQENFVSKDELNAKVQELENQISNILSWLEGLNYGY